MEGIVTSKIQGELVLSRKLEYRMVQTGTMSIVAITMIGDTSRE